jgi:hypothetical protein
MDIGFPYGDVVEDENTISRDNGNFRWISPYKIEMGQFKILIDRRLTSPPQPVSLNLYQVI